MRIGTMFYYTFIQNWREGSTYMEMLLLPMVLIYILGISLGNAFQPPLINDTEVAYLNEDKGLLGESFEIFIMNEEIGNLLQLTPVLSSEEGFRMVEEEQVHAFVHLPADALKEERGRIQLVGSLSHHFRVSMVENIMESFISGANTVLAMEEIHPDSLFRSRENAIEFRSLQDAGLRPGAMDYYAVTMLVMFMMYGTTYAVFGMKHGYLNATGLRIKTTPIHPVEHYLGLGLANVATVLTQGILLVVFTHFVFGVYWGNNLPLIFIILLLTAMMAVGLGTAILMGTRNESISGNIVMILVPFMTFMSGGFFRMDIPVGSFLHYAQHLSPNYLAQTALFNTIYSGNSHRSLFMMMLMILFIAISFFIALWSERRFRT